VPAQPQPHVATLTLPTTPAVARHPPGEPSAAEEARAEAAPAASPSSSHAEHFAWPVRGHVVAGYGAAVGGARNDGINIAAPQGTPVKAVDGGTVAYVGNELRGYGNLVLIKHEGGWISAYAHCETLLVKQGEKVSRGQDIAKVGATGGVSEPQLHFELRRGQRAVDPREFLAPAPSAGSAARRG
jgi:murein DD-endopeptidase MepM/ murein hydrolase activator NlpD